MNIYYTKMLNDSLQSLKIELRFKNIIELYKLGIYTEDEFKEEANTYFDMIKTMQRVKKKTD